MTRTAQQIVAEARASITEIAVQDVAKGVAGALIIDVREPAEYESGHLQGAINIPRGVLEFQVEAHPALGGATEPELAVRDRPVVLYCRTGGRSALAALSLQEMGFKDVRSMAGGITAWQEAQLPLRLR